MSLKKRKSSHGRKGRALSTVKVKRDGVRGVAPVKLQPGNLVVPQNRMVLGLPPGRIIRMYTDCDHAIVDWPVFADGDPNGLRDKQIMHVGELELVRNDLFFGIELLDGTRGFYLHREGEWA